MKNWKWYIWIIIAVVLIISTYFVADYFTKKQLENEKALGEPDGADADKQPEYQEKSYVGYCDKIRRECPEGYFVPATMSKPCHCKGYTTPTEQRK